MSNDRNLATLFSNNWGQCSQLSCFGISSRIVLTNINMSLFHLEAVLCCYWQPHWDTRPSSLISTPAKPGHFQPTGVHKIMLETLYSIYSQKCLMRCKKMYVYSPSLQYSLKCNVHLVLILRTWCHGHCWLITKAVLLHLHVAESQKWAPQHITSQVQ